MSAPIKKIHSGPFKNRPRPEGQPPEAWNAFAAWADFKGSFEERKEMWVKFLEINAKYYKDGKKIDKAGMQSSLFKDTTPPF
ncbi:hypothetical protein [Rufibacter soli]